MGRGIRERQKDMRSVFKSYYIVASKRPDVTQNKNLFFIKELDITHIPQRNLSTQTDLILDLALHWIICMAFNKPLAKPLGVSDPSSGKRVSGGDWRDVNGTEGDGRTNRTLSRESQTAGNLYLQWEPPVRWCGLTERIVTQVTFLLVQDYKITDLPSSQKNQC